MIAMSFRTPSCESDQLTQQAIDNPAFQRFVPCHSSKSLRCVSDSIVVCPLSVAICNHQAQGCPLRTEQIALSLPESARNSKLMSALPSGRQDTAPTQLPASILSVPVKFNNLT
jgi:hypothetical protein